MAFKFVFIFAVAAIVYAAEIRKPEPPKLASATEKSVSLIEKYRTLCETLDIKPILKNERIVTQFVKCALGEGNCPNKDGQKIASIIPEIMETNCATCSPKQKELMREIMKHMYNNRRPDFERIFVKFDPQHEHYDEAVKFLNAPPEVLKPTPPTLVKLPSKMKLQPKANEESPKAEAISEAKDIEELEAIITTMPTLITA